MGRSSQSKRWLKEHFADEYVKRAQKEGYRSRAVYKLIEIQEKDQLVKPGMIVVDLGAAPGGWSQVLTNWTGAKGKVFALDILEMDAIPGVVFMQGDFSESATVENFLHLVHQTMAPNEINSSETIKVDLVFSDMAPNMSGMNSVDQPRAMHLAEMALYFAEQVLKADGSFLVKVFQGAGFDKFLQTLKQGFARVAVRKPKASRGRSREVYLLAKGWKGSPSKRG